MQLIKRELNVNFIGMARFWIILSSVAVLVSISSFLTRGFNYGIDFLGGTAINVRFDPKAGATADRLRAALSRIDMGSASVQDYAGKESNEYLIKVRQSYAKLEDHEKEC